MCGAFEMKQIKMAAGPVMLQGEKGFFGNLQSLELMALMGSTAGAIYFDKAIMCNGANLAYRRSVFSELGGFGRGKDLPTGDDVLLMYALKEKYPGTIAFVKEKEAIV